MIKAASVGNRGRRQVAGKRMRHHYCIHLFGDERFADTQRGPNRIGIHFDYGVLVCHSFIDILRIEVKMLKYTSHTYDTLHYTESILDFLNSFSKI